ncbi:MAG: hypothetical protein APG12_00582 [Candidatus Methanofastidiosum methylothiophilum]|uniref:PhoU domain protein n=1 Tax=Candidatus Methanofastidiosum methylothiophilum TaxID=1705564 RepID=A0A150IM29_9EURY|nr:MAG: hypothetical protein APG10_00461 [Candidatus Methanofastidiosum methylthiophilus]KYC48355.1 MAG: hypothetical protein APG11_00368 [Candidatus Methanofastidiosum methylthiophilus]KYC50780.1 MAG: hypothetical protein APG12_00582 [Candidatus Methanofastidiosum methylthiophilus]
MVSFKLNLFNNDISKDYINDFHNQVKCVKDSVLTLEEAIKLLEKECIPEMEDKCKIVQELEKEGKIYQDKLKESIDKSQFLGPNETKYVEISTLIGDIGQKAKSISELLTNIKQEKLSKELIKDFVKLIETDESITRDIYLTMKKIEYMDDEKINRFSKKILKKKVEVEELSELILKKYDKQVEDSNLSSSFENIVGILKKIPGNAEDLILIINR